MTQVNITVLALKCNRLPFSQAFEMCLMDYDFMVLDNAFLIHRPGIKTVKNNPTKPQQKLVNETNKFIASVIKPDIKKKVGDRKGCH